MPGVLIVEAMAQAGAVAILKTHDIQLPKSYCAALNNVKFKGKVVPGDVLMLEVEIIKVKGPIGVGSGKAYVDGKLVTQAELTFAIG